MRFIALLATAAMASPVAAQVTVRTPAAGRVIRVGGDQARVGIGVTTTSGVSNRDTLGVLVAAVRPGSPAEKAGIEEGNRIAAINGVSLKLAAADVGEYEMSNIMTRRLTRELEKLKAGDDVTLQVYANGQNKTVKVKTVAPEEMSVVRRSADERATLGLNIGLTGSARDSIGVFVMGVVDGGPAAKAGIEEGSRIASINGVDLRAKKNADEEEGFIFRSTNANRLARELEKVKPGDDVDLRVYFNGQFRNVKVKTARSSDLPNRGRSITVIGGDGFAMPAIPPMPVMPRMPAMAPMPPDFPGRIELRTGELRDQVRRAVEGATRVGMAFGNRVVW